MRSATRSAVAPAATRSVQMLQDARPPPTRSDRRRTHPRIVPALVEAVRAMLEWVAMGGSLAILFVLPFLDRSKVRSARYRPMFKLMVIMFN